MASLIPSLSRLDAKKLSMQLHLRDWTGLFSFFWHLKNVSSLETVLLILGQKPNTMRTSHQSCILFFGIPVQYQSSDTLLLTWQRPFYLKNLLLLHIITWSTQSNNACHLQIPRTNSASWRTSLLCLSVELPPRPSMGTTDCIKKIF